MVVVLTCACRNFDAEYERTVARLQDGGTAGGHQGGGAGGGTAGGTAGGAAGGAAGGSAGGATGGSGGGAIVDAGCPSDYCFVDRDEVARRMGMGQDIICTTGVYDRFSTAHAYCNGGLPAEIYTLGNGLAHRTTLLRNSYTQSSGTDSDLWVVDGDNVFHGRGISLTSLGSTCDGTTISAQSVYSPAPGEAWVGCFGGQVCHIQLDAGQALTTLPSASAIDAIFVSNGVVLAGDSMGQVFRLDGTLEMALGSGVVSLQGIGGRVWAGTGDGVFERQADAGWSQVPLTAGHAITDLTAIADNDVWAVGRVDPWHLTDAGWEVVETNALGIPDFVPFGVRGSGSDLFWYGTTLGVDSFNSHNGVAARVLRRGH